MTYRYALAGAVALLSVAIGCATTTGLTSNTTTAAEAATVHRVIDGDTVALRYPGDPEPVRTRILGIDAPESVKPNAPIECWGPESSDWAKQVLTGQHVQVTTDPTQDDTDRYGRQLRYITLPDGRDFSTMAAAHGMAGAYIYGTTPLEKADVIAAAEDRARATGAGLWGACPTTR